MNKQSDVGLYFDERAAQWDEHYRRPGDITGYEVLRRKDLALAFLRRQYANSAARIVEIGCGTGRVIFEAVQPEQKWEGVGLDVSEKMVAWCRDKYAAHDRLLFGRHDIEGGPWRHQADVVLALGVLGYLSDLENAFSNISQMVVPGGWFVFSINKRSIPRSLTRLYKRLRFSGVSHPGANKALSVPRIYRQLESQYRVVETFDYCYLPYLPLIRKLVPVSRGLELLFGRRLTPLSSTTLFIAQKI